MVSTVHIDIEKAFDSISHQKLWQILYKYNFPCEIIDMIKWIYKNSHFNVNDEIINIRKGTL